MKSKRTVFAVIVMVLCLIAAAMVIIGFVNNWQNETIIDFIIKTIGIPALVCVAGLFLIGCSQSKFSVTALYAFLLGTAMSLLTNVIVVKNFTNDMITKMVENTPSHDSLAISTGESGGIGNMLTSILMFAIAGAIGGAIGRALNSAFGKMSHKTAA